MIAQLTGRVDGDRGRALHPGRDGVGYLVHASTRTLAALPPPPGAGAAADRDPCARGRDPALSASPTPAERDWFRLLTTVQGVGAKVALGILSALSPRDLVGAIAAGDKASLTRAPGVGAKLAVRLLTELRDKAGAMPSGRRRCPRAAPPAGVAEDALSALVNLGYRRAEAQPGVDRVVERLGEGAASTR